MKKNIKTMGIDGVILKFSIPIKGSARYKGFINNGLLLKEALMNHPGTRETCNINIKWLSDLVENPKSKRVEAALWNTPDSMLLDVLTYLLLELIT